MKNYDSRKPGRPSVYGFEAIEVDGSVFFRNSSSVEIERIRAAALSFGRRTGRWITSKKTEFGIVITRVS